MGKKILIVDDAPFIRDILISLLEKNDYIVAGEAENGKQAVDMALSLKPDLILMDIVMPVMSGIEATKTLISKSAKFKVIALSTLNQEQMIARAIDAGCSDYLTKPFTEKQLMAAIESALDMPEVNNNTDTNLVNKEETV